MYVILGATGKVGRASIRALRARGAPVRAVVRDPGGARDLADAGCEIAVATLDDITALTTALDGATAVQVICPMRQQASDAPSDMRHTIDATVTALTAAQAPAIVAISDYGAHRSTGTGVTLTFHYLETQLRRLPAAVTLLRSAEHMQNWSRFTRVAATTGALPSLHHPVTKPFPTVSALDVGTVAADLLMTADRSVPLRVVHVEGPRRYTARDAAAILGSVVGRDVTATAVPRPEWVPALMRGGLGASYAGLIAELFDAHNAGLIDVEDGAGDVRRGTTALDDVLSSLARVR